MNAAVADDATGSCSSGLVVAEHAAREQAGRARALRGGGAAAGAPTRTCTEFDGSSLAADADARGADRHLPFAPGGNASW